MTYARVLVLSVMIFLENIMKIIKNIDYIFTAIPIRSTGLHIRETLFGPLVLVFLPVCWVGGACTGQIR